MGSMLKSLFLLTGSFLLIIGLSSCYAQIPDNIMIKGSLQGSHVQNATISFDNQSGFCPDNNCAIEIPSELLKARHEGSILKINFRVKSIVSAESEKISEELNDISGFIDVKEKLEEIRERLQKVLTENPNYEDFANKLNELVMSHPFFKETENQR